MILMKKFKICVVLGIKLELKPKNGEINFFFFRNFNIFFEIRENIKRERFTTVLNNISIIKAKKSISEIFWQNLESKFGSKTEKK